MPATLIGATDWWMNRDKEGHRDYGIVWSVRTSNPREGPAFVMNCPQLPAVGSEWILYDDYDLWAFCAPEMEIRRDQADRERGVFWLVTQNFSTRPRNRCQDTSIEDPLQEPPQISGSYIKFLEESHIDKDGNTIKSSSHELFQGSEIEWDVNRPTVNISYNHLTLGMDIWSPMIDTVNDAVLWGFQPRCVKLSDISWQRKVYGLCYYYYTINYTFEIDSERTFDRKLVDRGNLVLNGHSLHTLWSEAPLDPDAPDIADTGHTYKENIKNFEQFKDINGENMSVLLDGKGRPLGAGEEPVTINFRKYRESNFLLLGIPATLS